MPNPKSSRAAIAALSAAIVAATDRDYEISFAENRATSRALEKQLLAACMEASDLAVGIAQHLEYGLGPEAAGRFETKLRLEIPKLYTCLRSKSFVGFATDGEDDEYSDAQEFIGEAVILSAAQLSEQTTAMKQRVYRH